MSEQTGVLLKNGEKVPTEKEILEVDIDPIYYLFLIMKNRLIPEEKAISYNWTNLFFKWLKIKIKSGQLIVIQIRGEVRTGKSTIGLVLKAFINQIIFELGKRPYPKDIQQFEFETILSDQTEFVRFTMEEHTQMCIQIDERNPMADGGANATTENQIIETNNNMFASEYVHRINCNPTRMTDENAFIHLETIGSKNGISRVRLKYCDNIGNEIRTLGYIDINVWELIKNWEENVRPIFEKPMRNAREEKFIEEQAKKDYYVRYQVKKEKRRKLMKKHKVRDLRELEFSVIVIKAYKELEDLITTERLAQEIMVEVVKDMCRENGKIYSMYAESIVVNKVKSLLTIQRMIKKYENKIEENKSRKRKNVMGKNLKTAHPIQEKQWEKTIKKFTNLFAKRIAEETKLAKLYDQYLEIQ